MRTLATTVTAVVALLGSSAIQAQEKTQVGPIQTPPADGKDWLKTRSGEWLRGEIVAMRDEVLEFDSEEFDELTLDWEDVAELHSPRPIMIQLEPQELTLAKLRNREELDLPSLRFVDDTVQLSDGQTLDRSDVLSIIPGKPSEWNYWSGQFSFGLTARSGNTDQSDTTLFAELKRETASTRGRLTYNAAISEIDGTETANNQRFNETFDIFLSRRLFLTAPTFEYYSDRFQNIDSRTTVGAGVGYDFVDRAAITWTAATGVAYQDTEFRSVPVGSVSRSEENAAVTLWTLREWDVTNDVEYSFEYRGQFDPNSSDANHNLRTALSVDLWGDMDLDVAVIWDRVENPRPREDGSIPEQDDVRLTVGFGWDF